MSETEDWLSRYAESHSELASPLVYWIAAPLVVLGTVGLLWSLPVPEEFYAISPLVNWGSLFLMATSIYYFIISVPLAIGMLPFVIGIAVFQSWLEATQPSPARIATGLLIAGLTGLLLSRRRGHTAKLVFQDLQLMMIGPAWLLSVLYRRMGIPI